MHARTHNHEKRASRRIGRFVRVHAIDRRALVVAAQQEEVLRVLDFVAENEADHLRCTALQHVDDATRCTALQRVDDATRCCKCT